MASDDGQKTEPPPEGEVLVSLELENLETCLFCGERGRTLYAGLRDVCWGAPGEWRCCECLGCGLIWLSPRPAVCELAKVYAKYYTHEGGGRLASMRERLICAMYSGIPGFEKVASNSLERCLGKMAVSVPVMKTRILTSMMYLEGTAGRVLDIGCGSGRFLGRMRKAGWDVAGVEIDRISADRARSSGVGSVFDDLNAPALGSHSFDAITMNHVIEHLYDPIGSLRRCLELLKPGGRLTVVTPNSDGLGHRVFGADWRGLEPPRHTYLFCRKTLESLLGRAGFAGASCETNPRRSGEIWRESWRIRAAMQGTKAPGMLSKIGFVAMEEVRSLYDDSVGEELVCVAVNR